MSDNKSDDDDLYFMEARIKGKTGWLFFCDDARNNTWGFYQSAITATALRAEEAESYRQRLIMSGIPIIEMRLIKCDSGKILTPEMRRVLNLIGANHAP